MLRLPHQHISTVNHKEYLEGYTTDELQEVYNEFNEFIGISCKENSTFINDHFILFMEEVFHYTYCDVCGANYHDEDPCELH